MLLLANDDDDNEDNDGVEESIDLDRQFQIHKYVKDSQKDLLTAAKTL